MSSTFDREAARRLPLAEATFRLFDFLFFVLNVLGCLFDLGFVFNFLDLNLFDFVLPLLNELFLNLFCFLNELFLNFFRFFRFRT